ncbi:DNA-dependent metalloprotease SPRTN-like [Haliotis rufescens]|uniref:DNA-dependent metalloprotease SPRTN-like n=1 Tax=Haliotis rufescens TaxID=6454 RepID=UPI00201E7B0F|nr:DNA-dependent metalloprotease SPRTN-like [Haliotis rufescens]
MGDRDFELARKLQEQFDREAANNIVSPPSSPRAPVPSKSPLSIVDQTWELTDPNPDIRALFLQYNDRFFWGRLAGIEVKWSPRMTLCAGLCVYERRGGLCSVRLSLPLLKLRPRKDLVETLLHEMIHAYLFVTNNDKDHDGHGPEFQKHMNRINTETGTNISIYHTFHDEVAEYRQHWWRCDGPCQKRRPYFGFVKRAMNRAPSSRDPWWGDHQRTCGGTYTKVKEPEGYGQKKGKKDKESKKEEVIPDKKTVKSPDIRSFWGQGQVTGSRVTSVKKPPSSTVTSSSQFSSNDDSQLPRLPPNFGSMKSSTETNPNQSKSSHVFTDINGAGSLNNRSSSVVMPTREPKPSVNRDKELFEKHEGDVSQRVKQTPVLGNSRIPSRTTGVLVKTIWDQTTSPNPSKKPGPISDGGPQICDINSVGTNDSGPSNVKFSGQGHVLGAERGQGTSFLAQLRREMNNRRTNNSPQTGSNTNRKKSVSPGEKYVSKIKSPSFHNTISPVKSIKEWFGTEAKMTSPNSPKQGSSTSKVNENSSSSKSPWGKETSSFIPHHQKSPDNHKKRKSVCVSDDSDISSPIKSLFKKVNPASNFTSPPYRRISLYNNTTPTKSSPNQNDLDCDVGNSQSSLNEHISRSKKAGTGSKRNNSSSSNDVPSKSKKGNVNRMSSWTRRPQYSSSDDSDIEEILPPTKKYKVGSHDSGDSYQVKNTDRVNKVKHKGGSASAGKAVGKKKSGNVKEQGGFSSRGDGGGSHTSSSAGLDQGGDNSSSTSSQDPLQNCPVCQTRVFASQMNVHLDQCLTFA